MFIARINELEVLKATAAKRLNNLNNIPVQNEEIRVEKWQVKQNIIILESNIDANKAMIQRKKLGLLK